MVVHIAALVPLHMLVKHPPLLAQLHFESAMHDFSSAYVHGVGTHRGDQVGK